MNFFKKTVNLVINNVIRDYRPKSIFSILFSIFFLKKSVNLGVNFVDYGI